MQLIRDWTFSYHGIITWAKLRAGKPTQYLQATTELLLFATKGRGPEIAARRRGQGTLLIAPLGIHSEKPDEALAIYQRVSHPPFVELFARVRPNSRTPWAIWGNEVDSDFTIPGFPVSSDFAHQGTDE
jgi:N6-adenosine-specific RNA methylase IME4